MTRPHLDNEASGNSALTLVRGACGTSAYMPSADHRFPQQATFPSIFRFQVDWVLQAPPSECFLIASGIPSSATRRTRKVSWAAREDRLAPEVRGFFRGLDASLKRLEVSCELEHSKKVNSLLVICRVLCYAHSSRWVYPIARKAKRLNCSREESRSWNIFSH